MIGAKLPFVLADWPGLLEGPGLAGERQDDRLRDGGRLPRRRAGQGDASGVRVKTGDGFAVPVAGAVAVGRLSVLRGGMLPRGRDRACPGASTSATGFADTRPSSTRWPSTPRCRPDRWPWLQRRGLFRGQLIKLYILSLPGLPIRDRVPQARAGPGPGPDRLPMGLPGPGSGLHAPLDQRRKGPRPRPLRIRPEITSRFHRCPETSGWPAATQPSSMSGSESRPVPNHESEVAIPFFLGLRFMRGVLLLAGLVLDHEHVETGEDKQRRRLAGQQAAQDRPGQRGIRLASRAR